jgi:hypothetical protein
MLEITVLLIVFVLSLIMGIALLEIAPQKRAAAGVRKEEGLEKRLERLEMLVLRKTSPPLMQAAGEKLHKLENFKANTEVEMQGLREMIEDIRHPSKKKKKARSSKKAGKKEQLSAKEMQRIVFRSG